MSRLKFSDIKPGFNYKIPVLLQSITDCVTANGSNYVKIAISDGTSIISANKFSCHAEDFTKRGIEPETIVLVSIENKNNFYNFSDILPCNDDSIDILEFVKSAPINIDKGFDYIMHQVKACGIPDENGHTRFSQATEYILNKYKDEFKHSSAAKSMHHNYVGGLVHHTATMIKMALKACEVYTDLDKELLICGCALHDIGKLVELQTSQTGNASYTIEGALLGHLWAGANLIEKIYREELKQPITDDVLMLLHMIASHHGKPEYGTIVVPAFKEAYMLHAIDMLDSRMQLFNNEYEQLEAGTVSEKQSFGLGTRVYKPIGTKKAGI